MILILLFNRHDTVSPVLLRRDDISSFLVTVMNSSPFAQQASPLPESSISQMEDFTLQFGTGGREDPNALLRVINVYNQRESSDIHL